MAALALLPACRPLVIISQLERATCLQEVHDAFGEQDATLIAVKAADGGPLFRPPVLEALDRVCHAFEEEMTDDLVAVKCLTSLPIMEGRPGGARVVIARDEFPFTLTEALTFQQLVLQLEFATGDVVDIGGSSRSFIHLPHSSFADVDLRALFEQQLAAEVDTLEMAIDTGETRDIAPYRVVAGDGPSSSYLVGIFDAGDSGGLKEPSALLALERFALAAEALPKVAQTFSIVDDLKVVRRGLHRGTPGEAIIPLKRSEVAQLLLALSMAPSASAFGPRMDSTEQVALVRVNLAAMNDETRGRISRRVDMALTRESPEGGRAFLCLD